MENELKTSIDKLRIELEKSNSLRFIFWRSVLTGFGVFVGSALLVALFVYILSLFDTTPFLGSYVSRILEVVTQTKK